MCIEGMFPTLIGGLGEGGQTDVTPSRGEASHRARGTIDKIIVAETVTEELL